MMRLVPRIAAFLTAGLFLVALLLGGWKTIERHRDGKLRYQAAHSLTGWHACLWLDGKKSCRELSRSEAIARDSKALKRDGPNMRRDQRKRLKRGIAATESANTWGYVLLGALLVGAFFFLVLGAVGFLWAAHEDRQALYQRISLFGGVLVAAAVGVVATMFIMAVSVPVGGPDRIVETIGVSFFLTQAGSVLGLVSAVGGRFIPVKA